MGIGRPDWTDLDPRIRLGVGMSFFAKKYSDMAKGMEQAEESALLLGDYVSPKDRQFKELIVALRSHRDRIDSILREVNPLECVLIRSISRRIE